MQGFHLRLKRGTSEHTRAYIGDDGVSWNTWRGIRRFIKTTVRSGQSWTIKTQKSLIRGIQV